VSADDGPIGRREVAHRLFAAEFDDASLSYSESDEERAPNYVVTPTGARVNRLFVVGVLTEVEAVNEETLRARVADPTGAFVSYAGQYQPDEMAFLDRTTPPAFLALTGKARTFEPEDSDRVFTSVRPESINDVDADTRDRWVVGTAEATLRRVAIFAEALDSGLTGDALQSALEDAGVDETLAAGVPKAIDHYGTTTAYLEAVRTLAVETLEVVADERDEATRLGLAPDEGGEATLGPLPDVTVDLSGAATTPSATSGAADAADATASDDEAASGSTETAATATSQTTETTGGDATVDAGTTDETSASAEPSSTDVATGDAQSADAATDGEPPGEASGEPDETTTADTGATTDTTGTADEAADVVDETADEDIGDFEPSAGTGSASEGSTGTAEAATDDTKAETGAAGAPADTTTDDTAADATTGDGAATDDSDADAEAAPGEEVPDEVLDDDTREAVEAEHGVGFSTGNEVGSAGEAGIDVPDADELAEMEAEARGETTSDDAGSAAASDEAATPSADESASTSTTGGGTEPTADDGAASSEDATAATDDDPATDPADVDLESAVVEAMKAEDTGDGAPREAVVEAVVDEYGVAEGDVDEAIEEALMDGLCYEAGGGLKPI
jgi:hypothetical protein